MRRALSRTAEAGQIRTQAPLTLFVGAVLFAARAATLQVAERLRARVDGLRLEGDGFGYVHLTVTIGVAHVDASSGDIAAVLRRADQAICTDKHEGRNRVWRA